jgi:hypothetical protein
VIDRDGSLRFYWPGDMIAYYQSKLLQDFVLVHAWQEVPKSAIIGMLDMIRTRVLTTAIDIKTDFENSGVDLATVKQNSPESEKAQQIVINQILHASFYVTSGNITQITQNIEAGNWDSLRTVLEKSGIDEAESAELERTLQHEKTMGKGVKGWIRRNSGKVVEKGLEVGTNLGAKVLTELITKYLGLPQPAG